MRRKKRERRSYINWVRISILSKVLLTPFPPLFREGINSRSRWLTLANRPSLIIQFVRKSVFNRQYLLQKHQTIQSSASRAVRTRRPESRSGIKSYSYQALLCNSQFDISSFSSSTYSISSRSKCGPNNCRLYYDFSP